jgi:hypothetical protein
MKYRSSKPVLDMNPVHASTGSARTGENHSPIVSVRSELVEGRCVPLLPPCLIGGLYLVLLFVLSSFLWGCTSTATAPGQRSTSIFGTSYTPVALSQECKGLQVKFTFERKSQVAAQYTLFITDEFGQPLFNITRIILAFTPLDQDDNNTVTLVAHPNPSDARSYAPKSTYAPNPGLWKVETVVRRDGTTDTLCTFTSQL